MVETPEGVSIGYDSQVSTGYQKTELEARKVFVNNGIIFGVAGSMLDAQTIRYAPMPDPAPVTNAVLPANVPLKLTVLPPVS